MSESKNKEREKKILDAASELILHFGYDKTSVSDIAKKARISKGAIYLHFKSKDELFEKLLIRDLQVYSEKWLELLYADPEGGTIAGMYKNMLYALSDSNLISALFKRDVNIFGNYLYKIKEFFGGLGNSTMKPDFIKLMQDAGAVRKDVNPNVTAHIMDILGYGILGIEKIKDEKDIPPINDLIEGIADFMDRALSPEGGGNREAGKEIIKQIADATRQQFKDEGKIQ